jgi:hypothetical protein
VTRLVSVGVSCANPAAYFLRCGLHGQAAEEVDEEEEEVPAEERKREEAAREEAAREESVREESADRVAGSDGVRERADDAPLLLAEAERWKDGTHSVLLDPFDNIRPSVRAHPATALSYAALLAGHSRDRAEVVPHDAPNENTDDETPNDAQQLLFEAAPPLEPPPPPPSRHPWAWLLQRVFAIDIMTCPRRRSAMRVIAVATEADDIRAVLGTVPRARPPPPLRQLELDFAAA